MTGYLGRVELSAGTLAYAAIADLDASQWTANVSDIKEFDFQPGLICIEVLDGPRSGLWAIGELKYPEGAQGVPYREGPAVMFGRTPFGPRPTSE